MKKQGKIISVPIREVTGGMQVLYLNSIYTIEDVSNNNHCVDIRQYSRGRFRFGRIKIERIKTLVVEYDEINNSEGYPIKATYQLPLKHFQWQAAIDNDEVDSNKVIEFEIYKPAALTGSYKSCNYWIAKVIPQKKRVYTEEEVYEILKEFRGECSMTVIFDSHILDFMNNSKLINKKL